MNGTIKPTDNPAKFSKEVLAQASAWIEIERDRVGRPLKIFDPFAGTGRVHGLRDQGHETVGLEIEPEWAAHSEHTLLGDILDPPFEVLTEKFDVLFCSPTYGNRMADKHNNQDPCKECRGAGLSDLPGTPQCKPCKGTGKSRRNTYTHVMGHQLHENNSGGMQWGTKYRNFHGAAYDIIYERMNDDALWIVNMSNHIRGGAEQLVVEWHLGYFIFDLHMKVLAVEPVRTQRNRQGANGDLRVENEFLIVCRKA